MKRPELLTQALLVVVIAVLAYQAFHGPAPVLPVTPEAPPPALATAALQYKSSLGPTFDGLARAIRGGQIKTRDQAHDYLQVSRRAFGEALDHEFAGHIDTKGQIVEPAALADDLDRVANALGAK